MFSPSLVFHRSIQFPLPNFQRSHFLPVESMRIPSSGERILSLTHVEMRAHLASGSINAVVLSIYCISYSDGFSTGESKYVCSVARTILFKEPWDWGPHSPHPLHGYEPGAREEVLPTDAMDL